MFQNARVETLESRTLLSADIVIRGHGDLIASGDSTPTTADFTDYGMIGVVEGAVSRNYTIRNRGTSRLTFTGTPKVSISGDNAADFSVVMQPTNSADQIVSRLAPGAQAEFAIRFDPSAAGHRNAIVTVESDDPDTPSYSFAITGEGITTRLYANGLQVAELTPGSGIAATNGMLLNLNYTGTLTTGTVFDTTNGTPTRLLLGDSAPLGLMKGMRGMMPGARRIIIIPASLAYGASGTSDGTIPGGATLIFDTSLISIDQQLRIYANGHEIIRGSTTPRPQDNTDFGYTNGTNDLEPTFYFFVSNEMARRAMRFTDPEGVSFTGPGASQFHFLKAPLAESGWTVSLGFFASTPGTYTAVASTTCSDAAYPTFTFAVRAQVLPPGLTFSSGVLTINGTAAADNIRVTTVGADIKTRLNGVVNYFRTGRVTAIRINAGGGDDLVTMDPTVTAPAVIVGGAGNDTLVGGSGADRLMGEDGSDSMQGGAGNDSLRGGRGPDTLLGEAGNDDLDGATGADSLSGGDGDDTLIGGANSDILIGDAGTNYFNAQDGAADTLDGTLGLNDTGLWDDGLDDILGTIVPA